MNETKYFLDQDDSSHWVIVRADKRDEWNKFLELEEDDERSWTLPDYVQEVGGNPNQIEFYLK